MTDTADTAARVAERCYFIRGTDGRQCLRIAGHHADHWFSYRTTPSFRLLPWIDGLLDEFSCTDIPFLTNAHEAVHALAAERDALSARVAELEAGLAGANECRECDNDRILELEAWRRVSIDALRHTIDSLQDARDGLTTPAYQRRAAANLGRVEAALKATGATLGWWTSKPEDLL